MGAGVGFLSGVGDLERCLDLAASVRTIEVRSRVIRRMRVHISKIFKIYKYKIY